MTRTQSMTAAGLALKKKKAVPAAYLEATAWKTPAELDPRKVLPGYILQFLYISWENYSEYENCRQAALSSFLAISRRRVHFKDPDSVWAVHCCSRKSPVGGSRIDDENAGVVLFATLHFVKRAIRRSQYSSLVFADLEQKSQ